MRNFEYMLKAAKESDKKAILEIVEMYRPLTIKYAMVNGKFDEDLYEECIYTMLLCIKKFPYKGRNTI